MDKVKEAVGLDKKQEEGQEPVSGQQGTAAGEPFDAGNSKEATQAADSSKDQGDKPSQSK